MRLEIELTAAEGNRLTLPLHYNKAVQGMIYHQISEYLPELHDHGYVIEGRTFRLFVFSRIEGDIVEIKDGQIIFGSPVRIQVGSPIVTFLELLANRLLQSQHINLSWCRLNVDTVSIRKNPDFSSGVATVRAISPITVYSTLMAANGSKKTYYYHPQEKEFSEQIRNNLYKKATLLNVDIGSAKFSIEPLRVRNTDLKTVYYHNFIIQGWLGQYLLKGTSQLLDIAYDTGLGAKNAQGFGMIDVIPNR